MFSLAVLLGPFIVILVVLFAANASIRILRQYERGVMFTLGCFSSVRGPGPIFLVPYVQRVVRVDLRTVVMEIPSQDLITRDNVSVKVDAVERYAAARDARSDAAIEPAVSGLRLAGIS
jgi:regulator of protease activity HflC (stomatin/prohibitin superfamily)